MSLLRKALTKNTATLPLKDISNGSDFFCINTHVINLLPTSVITTTAATLIGGPIGFLIASSTNAMSIIGQMNARDFIAIKEIKPNVFSSSTENPKRNEDYFIYGADVVAIDDGVVTAVRTTEKDVSGIEMFKVLGNYIEIKHPNGTFSVYGHLKEKSIKHKVGDKINKNDIIGNVGNTGNSSEPHLHFQINSTSVHEVALMGLITYSVEPNVFEKFQMRDLIKDNLFVYSLKTIAGLYDFNELLSKHKKIKKENSNELPEFGFIYP